MDDTRYTIESLINTFSQHSIKAEKDRKGWIMDFKKNYPDEPVPDHMLDDFCIAKALHHICKEVARLGRER